MAKTRDSFNLKKEVKRSLALFTDAQKRADYKRLMIDAQVSFENAKKQSIKSKRDSDSGE